MPASVIFFYDVEDDEISLLSKTSDEMAYLPRPGDKVELLREDYIVVSVDTVIPETYKPVYYRVNLKKFKSLQANVSNISECQNKEMDSGNLSIVAITS